jgi:Family of unknown function (DUF6524)
MIADGFPRITPLEAVCGILLLIGWLVYLNATFKAIGALGMLLAGALFAALAWLMTSWGWFTLSDTHVVIWLGLLVLAFILAVGMSWSHLPPLVQPGHRGRGGRREIGQDNSRQDAKTRRAVETHIY